MKMNPIYVHEFESNAEKKIFSLFERIDFELGTVFHSLNIPKHKKKQFAEADFVVVAPQGVLVLEVKGGRLSVRDGKWITKNRHGKAEELKESPLLQVKSAFSALRTMLQEREIDLDLRSVNFGYGLMFPDVVCGDIGIELTKEEVFDALDLDRKRLGEWLKKLYKYWSEKTNKRKRLNENEVKILCEALRKEFDREKSLLAEVDESWDQMVALTEQQYIAVDMILANKQVVIEGGAGTGKTLVAIKAAEALNARGDNVLFICRSPVLTSFINARLKHTNVRVVNFHTLGRLIAEGSTPDFTALVVDEGQDMLDLDSMDRLDSAFPNGFESGSWYFFMDPNNQGSLYADFDDSALDYLKSCGFTLPLTRNCRNTKQIATHTFLYTGGKIGECSVSAEGLPVIWKDQFYNERSDLIFLVEQQLEAWVDLEGVQLGDIVILSPLEFEKSTANELSKRWRRKIVVINENFGERWLDTQLPFSTIRDFKGLESRYVMLIDTDKLVSNKQAINKLYVAMTRANSVLWVATPKLHKEWFDQQRMKNIVNLKGF